MRPTRSSYRVWISLFEWRPISKAVYHQFLTIVFAFQSPPCRSSTPHTDLHVSPRTSVDPNPPPKNSPMYADTSQSGKYPGYNITGERCRHTRCLQDSILWLALGLRTTKKSWYTYYDQWRTHSQWLQLYIFIGGISEITTSPIPCLNLGGGDCWMGLSNIPTALELALCRCMFALLILFEFIMDFASNLFYLDFFSD